MRSFLIRDILADASPEKSKTETKELRSEDDTGSNVTPPEIHSPITSTPRTARASPTSSGLTGPMRLSEPRNRPSTAGRNPRVPFSRFQISMMEHKFRSKRYLSSAEVQDLAKRLSLCDTRIKIWFQNRRARERRDHANNTEKQNRDNAAMANFDFALPYPTSFQEALLMTAHRQQIQRSLHLETQPSLTSSPDNILLASVPQFLQTVSGLQASNPSVFAHAQGFPFHKLTSSSPIPALTKQDPDDTE